MTKPKTGSSRDIAILPLTIASLVFLVSFTGPLISFSQAQQQVTIEISLDPSTPIVDKDTSLKVTAKDSNGNPIQNVEFLIRIEDQDPLYNVDIFSKTVTAPTGTHTEQVKIPAHTCFEGAKWAAIVQVTKVNGVAINPIRNALEFSTQNAPAVQPAPAPAQPAPAPQQPQQPPAPAPVVAPAPAPAPAPVAQPAPQPVPAPVPAPQPQQPAPLPAPVQQPQQPAPQPGAPKPAQDVIPQQVQIQQTSMDMTLIIGAIAVIVIIVAVFGAMRMRKS